MQSHPKKSPTKGGFVKDNEFGGNLPRKPLEKRRRLFPPCPRPNEKDKNMPPWFGLGVLLLDAGVFRMCFAQSSLE
jgi:hypothetical protein